MYLTHHVFITRERTVPIRLPVGPTMLVVVDLRSCHNIMRKVGLTVFALMIQANQLVLVRSCLTPLPSMRLEFVVSMWMSLRERTFRD